MHDYYIKKIGDRQYLIRRGFAIGTYAPDAKHIYKKLSFLKKHRKLIEHINCPWCDKAIALYPAQLCIPCSKPAGTVQELGTYCCGRFVYRVTFAGRTLPTMYFMDLNRDPATPIANLWARVKVPKRLPTVNLARLRALREQLIHQNTQDVWIYDWDRIAALQRNEPPGTHGMRVTLDE